VLFSVFYLLFSVIFSFTSPGRGLIVLFFRLFCYFSVFFSLAPLLEIFLSTPLSKITKFLNNRNKKHHLDGRMLRVREVESSNPRRPNLTMCYGLALLQYLRK